MSAGSIASGTPDISVVIVTRNVRALLQECLSSLMLDLAQIPCAEVYVVDNASTDGSAAMVRAEFPDVLLIVSDRDRGFAAANNLALRRCRGRHVLLLNSDTRVLPGAIPALIRYLDEHPRVGMVGPQLLNPDGSIQRSCWKLPTLERIVYEGLLLDALFRTHVRIGNYEDWRHDRERTIEFLVSAAVLIRGSALHQIGLLDERFFIFGDDYDFCRRLTQAGWLIRYLPGAQIVHYGGQSTSAVTPVAAIVEANRSKDRYYRKHYGALGLLVYKAFSISGVAIKLSLLALAPMLSPRNRSSGKNIMFARYRAQLLYHLGLGDRRGLNPYWIKQP